MSIGTETTKVIAPSLFKAGCLLSITFHGWTGTATLSEPDAEAFGRQQDGDFFKKNQITLVSKEILKKFDQERGKLDTFMLKYSRDFPIRGARMVPHGNVQLVIDELRKARVAYEAMAEKFINEEFEPECQRRLDMFEQRHPGMRDRFAAYFPNAEALKGKFSVSWIFYEIKDVEALDAIMNEEQANYRGVMSNYLLGLAQEMREKALEAAMAFQKAMQKDSGVVRSTSIQAFVDFIDRFERNDFMNDRELREMLASMRTQVTSVENWSVSDNLQSIDTIRQGLSQLIETAQNEAAASLVTAEFLGISHGDLEIEEDVEVSQALPDAGEDLNTGVSMETEQEPAPALGS